MFRFILGLVTGVIVGVAATTLGSGQGGIDLRAEFERVRSDIEKRDFEALGAHLEERFKELQAYLEDRYAQAAGAVEEDVSEVEEAAEKAVDEMAEGAEDVAEAVEEELKA